MNSRRFNYEGWLYGLAFLIALGLRLIKLGAMPLNDAEADLALQALQISQGLKPALGPHPAYILFTSSLFFIYGGGTNFLARLVPAVIGSSLALAPWLFAERLKPRPALLLAFFIAIDPGLNAVSRQAGSAILAITFLVFAIGFLNQRKSRLAGGLAALAVLGGPAVWAGLLSLGISWAILQSMSSNIFSREPVPGSRPLKSEIREALIPCIGILITAGTLFLIVPNGLSAAALSIPAYLRGWIMPSTMRVGWMLLSLPVYQPLGLMLALLAALRGWRFASRRVMLLSVWWIVSLLLSIFYPGRQVTDLAWTLLPLWALAAVELARYFDVRPDERGEAVGAILLTVFLFVFGWLNSTSLTWISPGSPDYNLRIGLVIGTFVLLAFSLVLVAFGWSVRIAKLGAVWGLGLSFGMLGVAGTFGTIGLRGMTNPELWWPPEIPKQAGILESTVDDLSEWGTGFDQALPVLIYGLDSPSLVWALREHHVSTVEALDFSSSPPLVITNFEGDPGLAAAYRGQDFVWKLVTSWEIARPGDWLRWLAVREMTQTGENIILWAREDLFLGTAHPSIQQPLLP